MFQFCHYLVGLLLGVFTCGYAGRAGIVSALYFVFMIDIPLVGVQASFGDTPPNWAWLVRL
jgi:hypothetical protein